MVVKSLVCGVLHVNGLSDHRSLPEDSPSISLLPWYVDDERLVSLFRLRIVISISSSESSMESSVSASASTASVIKSLAIATALSLNCQTGIVGTGMLHVSKLVYVNVNVVSYTKLCSCLEMSCLGWYRVTLATLVTLRTILESHISERLGVVSLLYPHPLSLRAILLGVGVASSTVIVQIGAVWGNV